MDHVEALSRSGQHNVKLGGSMRGAGEDALRLDHDDNVEFPALGLSWRRQRGCHVEVHAFRDDHCQQTLVRMVAGSIGYRGSEVVEVDLAG